MDIISLVVSVALGWALGRLMSKYDVPVTEVLVIVVGIGYLIMT